MANENVFTEYQAAMLSAAGEIAQLAKTIATTADTSPAVKEIATVPTILKTLAAFLISQEQAEAAAAALATTTGDFPRAREAAEVKHCFRELALKAHDLAVMHIKIYADCIAQYYRAVFAELNAAETAHLASPERIEKARSLATARLSIGGTLAPIVSQLAAAYTEAVARITQAGSAVKEESGS
jgi:hypothetical protein